MGDQSSLKKKFKMLSKLTFNIFLLSICVALTSAKSLEERLLKDLEQKNRKSSPHDPLEDFLFKQKALGMDYDSKDDIPLNKLLPLMTKMERLEETMGRLLGEEGKGGGGSLWEDDYDYDKDKGDSLWEDDYDYYDNEKSRDISSDEEIK